MSVKSFIGRYKFDLSGVLYEMARLPTDEWQEKDSAVRELAKARLKSLRKYSADDPFLWGEVGHYLRKVLLEEERLGSARRETEYEDVFCPHCGNGFISGNYLREHMITDHLDEL